MKFKSVLSLGFLVVTICALLAFHFTNSRLRLDKTSSSNQKFSPQYSDERNVAHTTTTPVLTSVNHVNTATPVVPSTEGPENNSELKDTFIASRYDKTRVFFAVAWGDSETFKFDWGQPGNQELGAPVAKYGPDSLVSASAQTVSDNAKFFKYANVGEEWQLEVSPSSRMSVIITEPVVASVVGNTMTGFLAQVKPEFQPEFIASPNQYFVIHQLSSSFNQRMKNSAGLGRVPNWKATPELRNQIETFLNAQMKKQLASMHHFAYQDENASKQFPELSKTFVHWREIDEKLRNDKGQLDYDVAAFQLTPDDVPRLFIRARWLIGKDPAFLMSAWMRIKPELTPDFIDARPSEVIRTIDGYKPDLDSLGTILNIVGEANDDHVYFLMFTPEYEGYSIALFRYSDKGPVDTGISFGGSA